MAAGPVVRGRRKPEENLILGHRRYGSLHPSLDCARGRKADPLETRKGKSTLPRFFISFKSSALLYLSRRRREENPSEAFRVHS